jgi:hypothetical protein
LERVLGGVGARVWGGRRRVFSLLLQCVDFECSPLRACHLVEKNIPEWDSLGCTKLMNADVWRLTVHKSIHDAHGSENLLLAPHQ